MSHVNKKSLIGQVDDRLQKMTREGIGRSKHQDKIDDMTYKYIYSWSTYQSYIKHCCYFVTGARKIMAARQLNSAGSTFRNG